LDFTPFIGLGAGGRTYKYRDLDDVDSRTHFLGYGALGGELGFGRIGVRLEGRDHVSGFKPLTRDGETRSRNDVTLAAGLTLASDARAQRLRAAISIWRWIPMRRATDPTPGRRRPHMQQHCR